MSSSQATAVQHMVESDTIAETSKKSKSFPKKATIAVYSAAFCVIIAALAVGYQPPQQGDSVASVTPSAEANATQSSVDQVLATNLAASAAAQIDSPVARNVANMSVSVSAKNELTQSEAAVVTKPQIVQVSEDGRAIKTYKTKRGDTAETVARAYGISTNTLRWANNLEGDAIEPNRTLKILPVDGVLYQTKSGDTVEELAKTYNTDADRIKTFNDMELTGIKANKQIIIPGGVKPAETTPADTGTQTTTTPSGSGLGDTAVSNNQIATASAGNRYAVGNCTWYVYERILQLGGRPVGSFWGNATSWASMAQSAGFTVNNTPAVGAIAQWNSFQGGSGYAGHVAVVERVNPDGTIFITEMNFAGNFNRVTTRTIPASSVNSFIHT